MSSEADMRISQLSAQTGIPVATIKFYLRENLLHDGARTSATQAQYDESHVARHSADPRADGTRRALRCRGVSRDQSH